MISTSCFVRELLLHDFPLRYTNKVLPSVSTGHMQFYFLGRSTFPGAEPPAGPKISSKSMGESTFPKILVHAQNFGRKIEHENKFSWTSRMDHRTRLDLK